MDSTLIGGILAAASLVMNGYFLVLAIVNVVELRRSTLPADPRASEPISVIIPARNEERDLAACLDSLARQDYPDYEVIVVDDCSTDRTRLIAESFADRHPLFQVVAGRPLPDGWSGKNWAVHQGVLAARGSIYLFTDADTVHGPDSLAFVRANLEGHDAGFLSGYPDNPLVRFGEKITVSLMYMMTAMLLPLPLIRRTRTAGLSFAIGQYMAATAEAYSAAGGHQAIAERFQDDIQLARRFKAAGCTTVFVDAKAQVRSRMYRGYRESFRGISRNIYAFLNRNPLQLAGIYLMVFLGVLYPIYRPLSLAFSGRPVGTAGLPLLFFAASWTIGLLDRDQDWLTILLFPLTFLNLIVLGTHSMLKTGAAGIGIPWKGRLVK